MKTTAIVILAACGTFARADSLEEEQYWEGQMDYVKRSLDEAEAKCGVKLTFDWVDKPKLRAAAEKDGNTPNGICAAVVDQVVTICREGEKPAKRVAATFKGFKCGYAKKRSLDLKKGTITYLGNNTESNFGDWAGPWLKKKL